VLFEREGLLLCITRHVRRRHGVSHAIAIKHCNASIVIVNLCSGDTALMACAHCGVESNSSLCARCHQLHECNYCMRRLPSGCLDCDTSQLCQACTKKIANPNFRSASNGVVTECDIQTNDTDTTFEAFVERNAYEIRQIVDEHRRRLR